MSTAKKKRERRLRRVDLRKSNPELWYSILTSGCSSVLLLLNFWLFTPTFTPYGISKNFAGIAFGLVGLALLTSLIIVRNLRVMRIMLTVSFIWTAFWGGFNTQQWAAGKASLQLPIVLITLAVLQIIMLISPPTNPYAEKD